MDGFFVPYDDFMPALRTFNCPCCMGVTLMPDGEELEQFITEQIDGERIKNAILSLEIEQMNKSLEKTKEVMNVER